MCLLRGARGEKLNKVAGVNASVNLATESAHVELSAPVDPQQLVAVVEKLVTAPL